MKHRRYSIATAIVTAFTILIMAVTLVFNVRSYEITAVSFKVWPPITPTS